MKFYEGLKPTAQAAGEIIATPAMVAYNAGRAVCNAVTTIPAMHSEMVAMRQELTEVNVNLRTFDQNMGEQMESVRQQVALVPTELESSLLPLRSIDRLIRPVRSRQEARRLQNGHGVVVGRNGSSADHELPSPS